ncbi:MAG TPA: MBL fold metallo-hydrolase [Vicinamibacterales bacterium]|jgi:glyoxylase-like metal-dependent hydrolase (beta-lactamase superfamily II)
MLTKTSLAALLAALVATGASAQSADTAIAAAAKAMGAESLTSITYSGSASTGNFGQSKTIAGPLQITTVSNYTRAIDLNQPASRATGTTQPPTIPGAPPPQPGTLNQNITPANPAWTQQLEIWITPWAFLKGAAANKATVRQQRVGGKTYNVVSWTPPAKSPAGQPYRLNGYINDQNMVERVETWVEHPVMGDLHVDTTYSGYQDFSGLKVPTKIVQKRAGLQTFEATIASARANPANIAELLQPPAPAGGAGGRGGAPPPAPAPVLNAEKMADGVYRITGGYVALAVEFKDHVVVLEGGQSEARGLAVIAETKKLFPTKPIKYVVNTHAHFDHASGLAPFAAEGIAIVTHANNREYLDKALSAPRTLVGDSLAKAGKKPKVEAAGDKRVLKDDTRTIELHHVKGLEHSDGMLIAFLPKERILFTGDFNIPAAGQPVSPAIATLVANVERLKLDFEPHVLVHAPNPDRPLTKADLLSLAKGTN